MLTRRNGLYLLAACFAPSFVKAGPDFSQTKENRPILRIAVQGLPASLEPLDAISNVGLRPITCLFDRPLRRDFAAEALNPGRSAVVPELATSLKRIDPLVWELELRPNVKLHDGTIFSAADLIATFSPERIGKATPYPEGRVLFGHIDGVERIDDLNVRFHTKTPDVIMDQRLAAYGSWVIGAKALSEIGLDGLRTKPVGTGPYKIAAFSRDRRLILDSHDDYWMGKPAACQVRIDVVPEAATRVAGLISGEYEIVTNLLPDQVPQFKGYEDIEVISVPLDLVHMLYFDTRRPNVSDPRVRTALNCAIDYEALGRAIWGPTFNRPNGLQTPAFGELYEPNRRFFAYDPNKAKRLLAEAGYKGEEITFRLASGYYVGSDDAAQIIQAMWNKVGIKMRLELVESRTKAAEAGADVYMTSAAFRFPDPLGGGAIVAFGPDSGIQKAGFWTPKTDYNAKAAALQQARDPAERRHLFQHLLDLFEREAPATILYAANEIYAKRKSVRFTHYPLYYLDLRPYNFSFS
jgi:peptide/nickel transport system substrate-binding protein